MSALSDLRDQLETALTGAGLHAFSIIPEQVDPPFVAVGPDEPYVAYDGEAGLNFGEARVRHRLTLVVERGENDVEADALDELILEVLAIDWDALGFQLNEVGEPGPAPVNKQIYLGVNVRLSTTIRL